MAKKLSYERYSWFHGRVKAGLFPNSARLAVHFEISRKQAQRDIGSLRSQIRDFALSHIRTVQPCSEPLVLPPGVSLIKEYIHLSFGVITGERSTDVVLRFAPVISSWITEQEWHEAQEVSVGEDGSLRLRFPVSGFVEVAREILKYGAAVEILEPKELCDTVRKEIRNMGTLYR